MGASRLLPGSKPRKQRPRPHEHRFANRHAARPGGWGIRAAMPTRSSLGSPQPPMISARAATFGSRRPRSPLPTTAKPPAPAKPPVDVTCSGPFHFDFQTYIASFDRDVEVVQLNPEGPSDQMSCQQLDIHFAPKPADGDRRPPPIPHASNKRTSANSPRKPSSLKVIRWSSFRRRAEKRMIAEIERPCQPNRAANSAAKSDSQRRPGRLAHSRSECAPRSDDSVSTTGPRCNDQNRQLPRRRPRHAPLRAGPQKAGSSVRRRLESIGRARSQQRPTRADVDRPPTNVDDGLGALTADQVTVFLRELETDRRGRTRGDATAQTARRTKKSKCRSRPDGRGRPGRSRFAATAGPHSRTQGAVPGRDAAAVAQARIRPPSNAAARRQQPAEQRGHPQSRAAGQFTQCAARRCESNRRGRNPASDRHSRSEDGANECGLQRPRRISPSSQAGRHRRAARCPRQPT